jgi:hypothetical protein
MQEDDAMKLYSVLAILTLVLAACASVTPTPSAHPTLPPSPAQTSTASPPAALPPREPTAALNATATGDRQAVFPNTIIVYQRQVGPGGNPQQWTFYRTGRIVAIDSTEWQSPADQVKLLFTLAESPDYWNLNDSYSAASECPGCMVHTLTVYREGKIKKIMMTQGADLPVNLQRMLSEIDRLITR